MAKTLAPTVAKGFPTATALLASFGASAFVRSMTPITTPKAKTLTVTMTGAVAPLVSIPKTTYDFEFEREKFRPIIFQAPKIKERKIPALIPRIIPRGFEHEIEKFRPFMVEREKVKQKEKLVLIPRLLQKQITFQPPILKPPTPTPDIPTPRPPYAFRLPEAVFKRRKGGLFGGWFLKKHPLPTGMELSRRLLGKSKRKRGKKKKGYII